MPFAAMWIELEGIKLSEISESEKDRYISTHMWTLRNFTEDHGGREGGKKKVTESEGGKP